MFFDQIVGANILVTTAFALTDQYNANPPGMAPFFIGLSATAMGLAFGGNAGYVEYGNFIGILITPEIQVMFKYFVKQFEILKLF